MFSAVAVATVGVAACGSSSDKAATSGEKPATAASPTKIKIAVGAKALTFGPILLADAAGYFKQQGLDVSIIETGSGALTFPAVLNGDTPFGGIVFGDAMKAAAKGQDVVTIAPEMAQYGSNMVVSKKFADKHGITPSMTWQEKAKRLKGAKLAISSPGSGDDKLFRFVLTSVGLNPDKDVTLTGIPSASSNLQALKAGRIDGFAVGAPAPDEAVAMGIAYFIARPSTGEIAQLNGFTYTTLAANKNYIKQHPETVQKVVNAMAAALKLIHDDPKKAEQLLHDNFFQTIPQNVMDEIWANNKDAFPATPAIPDNALSQNAKFLGLTPPPASSIIDNSFANKAAASH
jgi:NitT/TauT family transport system substrate-binding protein